MNVSRPPKKPPDPSAVSGRATAEGAGEILREKLTTEDNGLGPVGERALISLLDEADRDEEQHRTLMKFTPRWRVFIRRQDDTRLNAADDVIDDWLERKAMRRFWVRVWRLAVLVAGGGIAWGSGFMEKALPLIKKVLQAVGGAT